MRKCPKCGTILDDTKRKCYMCGSDIQLKTQIDFLNGFDDQVGAAVTKSQDNVFNSVPDISVKLDDVMPKAEENVTFTSSSNSADVFKNQLNNLNSMQYDERTAIEKIFTTDSRFRNKDEINAEEAMKKNPKKEVEENPFFSGTNTTNVVSSENVQQENPFKDNGLEQNPFQNNVNNQTNNDTLFQQMGNDSMQQQMIPPMNQQLNQSMQQTQIVQNNQQPVMPVAPVVKEKKKKNKKKKEIPSINWGNNLTNNSDNFSFKFLNGNKNKFKVSPSFIFNTVCFVLFASALIFMYFKFRNDPDKTGIVELGGLSYKIDAKFNLKDNENFTKYYTHGDNCVVRISFSKTSDPVGFMENYFDKVQEEYNTENGYITQRNELKLNGNTWAEITVAEFKDNPAATGGYGIFPKYKFVTMVYESNFYEIRYVNLDNDSTCSAMYDDLLESLEFIEE